MSALASPVVRNCVRCSVLFMTRYRRTRYCSRSCVWHATKSVEFNARISRESAKARGDAKRDPPGATYYRKVNGRHEHRVVAERMLGRALRGDEVVHHRDRNRRNNHPDNLVVMTRAEHVREHAPEKFR